MERGRWELGRWDLGSGGGGITISGHIQPYYSILYAYNSIAGSTAVELNLILTAFLEKK